MMNLMEAFQKTMTTEGIISDLFDFLTQHQIECGFLPSQGIASNLDDYYYFAWSGDKWASPVVEKMVKLEQIHYLTPMFWSVYGEQLLRQWDNFTREYDPIADYDVTEETGYTHHGGGKVTDSGDDTRSKWNSVESTSSVWGVNSSSAVDSDKTVTNYGNSENNGLKDKVEYGKIRSSTENANDELSIHKYGNLGINPISDFIKKDIELWKLNFYQNIFFKALDSFLALPIY